MPKSKIHRLELRDFKSYAGTVGIGPFHDFTCVVGPNGSGKSNMLDALSFAFSSSIAAVRGVPLTDFIHRKASSKSCSVTVVIRRSSSSSDTEMRKKKKNVGTVVETSFTRLINSQGESAYRIDGEIVDSVVYMKTLHSHEISERIQNFIVFQHEVEAVRQKNPLELSAMIEEVSGGAALKEEYELKKKEVEKANDAFAKASLEKRGATMEMNQIELVKKDTERFHEVEAQIKQERSNLELSELFYVETVLTQQKEELFRFNETLDSLQKGIPSEASLRAMKQKFIDHHKVYMEELKNSRTISEALREKLSQVERMKVTIDYLSRHQVAQKKELEGIKKDAASRTSEMKRLQAQKTRYETLLKEFDEEVEKENAKSAEASENLGIKEIEEYHRLQGEVECQTVTKRRHCETLEKELQALNAAVEATATAKELTQLRRKELAEMVAHLQRQLSDLKKRKNDLLQNAKTLEEEIKASQVSQRQLRQQHTNREGELYRIQEQLRELRHVKDADKQNNRTAETIQTLKSLFSIRGRLVDLCTIPDSAYRNALTVALGKNLDALIVENAEIAIKCVSYLKEQRLPCMTFLPLDSISGKKVTDRLRTFGGTCKPLIDMIQYEAEIEPVVQYALGETLVCATLQEAKKVAYGNSNGERFKVVTLDGSVLLKNGVIQGGLASILSRAKKWDDKKYEELRLKRDQLLQDALRGGEAELARLQVELRDMTSRLDFTRERSKVIDSEIATTTKRLDAVIPEEAELIAKIKSMDEKVSKLEQEKEKIMAEVLSVKDAIKQVEKEVFADLQKRVDVHKLLEAESAKKQKKLEHGRRRQELVIVIHKLESAIELEEKRSGVRLASEAQTAYELKAKELQQHIETRKETEKESERLSQQNTAIRKKLLHLREEMDLLQKNIRDSSKSAEAEINRLTLARKGGAGLEIACESLRQRRAAILRRCQMNGVEVILIPAPQELGEKHKRDESEIPRNAAPTSTRRGQNSTKKNSVLREIMRSEAFVLPSNAEISSDSRDTSQGSSSPDMVCIDFSGVSETIREAGASREQLTAFQQRTQNLLEKLMVEIEGLGPQIKAAERLVSFHGRLERSTALVEESRLSVRKANAEFQDVRQRRTACFKAVFDKLATHVDRIYKELTAGTRSHGAPGSAYLSLENLEEPYLGGTAFHVTPPLKRFMPMEFLSGGERTMAALALLFSIHAVSPSPFFVLDEVDAALDSGNVEKLARYIRQNAQSCQFIVVSHKDQLYSLADVLLGVTGEKKEVSRVLSLDLRGYTF